MLNSTKVVTSIPTGLRRRGRRPGFLGFRINISIFLVFLIALLVNKVFWFLPFVLIIPVIVTLVLVNPLIFLGFLVVLFEFFSTSVPGIMTMVVLFPWLTVKLVKRFYKEVKIDFSIWFYLLVGLMILGQLVLISLNQVIHPWLESSEVQKQSWQILLALPWLRVMLMLVVSTFITATASIFIRFNTSSQ
jgi:hypothetical protein